MPVGNQGICDIGNVGYVETGVCDMDNLIDLYGDVVVTVIALILSITFLGVCIEIYKVGVESLLDSIMYGGLR